MQGALNDAGIFGRNNFRTGQVEFQKLVRDDETASRAAIQQMMPAGDPEIFHRRGPPVAGSRQAVWSRAGSNARRSGLESFARKISKSPFSAISRRTPLSRGSRVRYSLAMAAKPCSCQVST